MKYNVNDYVQSSTEELSVQEYLKASVLSSAWWKQVVFTCPCMQPPIFVRNAGKLYIKRMRETSEGKYF